MEKNRHPQDFHAGFIRAKEESINRTLDFFEKQTGELKDFNLAAIAVASALGYMRLRLPQLADEKKYPKLFAWMNTLSQRPSVSQTIPAA